MEQVSSPLPISEKISASEEVQEASIDKTPITSSALNLVEENPIRKRRRSRDNENLGDGEEPVAKILIEESDFNLTYFADEILSHIFLFLDGNDLYQLQSTCYRFFKLIQDRRFWKSIDLSSVRHSVQDIKHRLKWANEQTQIVKVRGFVETFPMNKWKTLTVTEPLLRTLSDTCINLHTLEMYSSYLNLEMIQLTDFPATIKRLVFNDCSVRWPKTTPSFFSGMEAHFPSLEELGIERCNWFDPYDLMVFSKVPKLRWLSLRGCDNVKEFVPYGSIATRFGFKKLEYLDVRFTPITDTDLQCFNSVLSLKEILLECPTDLRNDPSYAVPAGTSSESQEPSLPSTSSAADVRPANGVDDRNRNRNSNPSLPSVPSTENERESRVVNNRFVLNPDRVLYITLDERRRQLLRDNNVEAVNEIPQYLPVAIEYPADQPFLQRLNYRIMDRALHFEREHFSQRIGPISDRGVFCFGRPRNPVQEGLICIRSLNRPDKNGFERMTIRHYKQVTNLSLQHLVQCSPKLVYLDVTGSSITKDAINVFKLSKPDCVVISHNVDV